MKSKEETKEGSSDVFGLLLTGGGRDELSLFPRSSGIPPPSGSFGKKIFRPPSHLQIRERDLVNRVPPYNDGLVLSHCVSPSSPPPRLLLLHFPPVGQAKMEGEEEPRPDVLSSLP
ncbi:hypothetical protein CSUI_005432 [Cystoisospora suis]|uniref:Uncharacterized protein n=1 Tax=Cystoisospora suis TaxID=483139 RepID=A0A2C6K664_9APIC|nr:hypothetical protein CSUI_005432 [Cystoisospora suis]